MTDSWATAPDPESFEFSIPERVQAQARLTPTREALCIGDESVSYQELHNRASAVARRLVSALGEGSEPVCLFLGKSPTQVVGFLGTLYAGKIAVLLEVSDPRARLEGLLRAVAPRVILTDSNTAGECDQIAGTGASVLNIDQMKPGSDDEEQIDLPDVSPHSLATVLFTSGTTGEPKGVMQTHRNWLHVVYRYSKALRLGREDRLFRPGSFAFAAGVRALFGALTQGATLVSEGNGSRDPLGMLGPHRVTLLHTPVNLFRLFLDTIEDVKQLSSMRCVFVAGDALRTRDAKKFLATFPESTQLIHALASTECSTIRQCFVDRDTPLDDLFVPVGEAVDDMEILLVDSDGKEAPNGSTGVIAVRSEYIALGYWGRQDLTEASFRPDPDGSSKRIFLTEDIGEIRNGLLIHHGRKDSVVKIRGFQVDLMTVAAALVAVPGVKDCAVLDNDNKGDSQLVGYVVLDERRTDDSPWLRQQLAETQPEYMIPSIFVFLDEIPRNAHGKLDVSRLPAMDDHATPGSMSAAPRTPIEEALAAIWQDVLGIKRIGIHDNFFKLGGHSLSVVRVTARAEKNLGLTIPLGAIFQAPTIEELAIVVIEKQLSLAGEAGFKLTDSN